MNIISNSCVGGHLYKNEFKTEFKNPFVWELIDFNSMLYLIKNWDNINWYNFELEKDANWNFRIIIENKITIKYVHYKFDKNANHPYKKDIDVFSNKIWEYIVDKYLKRIARMIKTREKPIFIFADRWNRKDTSLNQKRLELLNELKQDNIIAKFKYLKQIKRNPVKNHHNDILAKEIFNNFFK